MTDVARGTHPRRPRLRRTRRRRHPRRRAPTPTTRAEINDLFERYGLLVFEGVEPNPQMQVAISTVFGPLKDHPSQATPRAGGELGVIEIRHLPNEGGRVRLAARSSSQWLPWHFDHCYNDELNRAGVLRAVEIPPEGGRTGFVDGIALYRAISPELRDRIEGETVLYAMDVIMDNLRFGRPADLVEVEASPEAEAVMVEFADRPRALHPAVLDAAHRREGAARVAVDGEGSRRPRGRRRRRAARGGVRRDLRGGAPTSATSTSGDPTDMVIWDNWRVLHSRVGDDARPTAGACTAPRSRVTTASAASRTGRRSRSADAARDHARNRQRG